MPLEVVVDEDLSVTASPCATAWGGCRRPEASAPPVVRSAGKMRITLWSQLAIAKSWMMSLKGALISM
eukprot:2036948-Amphidinium_carterae.1